MGRRSISFPAHVMKAGHECPLEKKIEKKSGLSRFPAKMAHRKLREFPLFPAIFQFSPVITPTRESFVKLCKPP